MNEHKNRKSILGVCFTICRYQKYKHENMSATYTHTSFADRNLNNGMTRSTSTFSIIHFPLLWTTFDSVCLVYILECINSKSSSSVLRVWNNFRHSLSTRCACVYGLECNTFEYIKS